jgi:hypothetical protein
VQDFGQPVAVDSRVRCGEVYEGAVGGCLVELLVISDGGEECINSIMGLMAFFGAKLVWGKDVMSGCEG